MRNIVDQLPLTVLRQRGPLGDRMRAMIALIGPILWSQTLGLNAERLNDLAGGDRAAVRVRQLFAIKREDDGLFGDAFEYAVHTAIRRCDRQVVDPMFEVLLAHGIPDEELDSIFFARDKGGEAVLIDPSPHTVGDQTLLIPGQRGEPVAISPHLPVIDKALRSAKWRSELPAAISGIAQADLLVGNCEVDQWLGATVKSNAAKLTGAAGLTLGIVPCDPGEPARARKSEKLGLWVVSVPYDGEFMEVFCSAWSMLTRFLANDTHVPHVRDLAEVEYREVLGLLEQWRDDTVVEVVARLEELSQTDLVTVEDIVVPTLASGQPGAAAPLSAALRLVAVPMTTEPATV